MSRLVRVSGLTFSQLRLLSARAKNTRASTATLPQGDTEQQRTRDSDVRGVEVSQSESNSGGGGRVAHSRAVQTSLSLHDSQYITALLDAFLTLGMASEAEAIFNRYRRDGQHFPVSMYNKLLQSWVKKGSQLRAVMLFESMRRDDVEVDAQSYAIMLILHTRHKNWESARQIIRQMEAKGFLLKHIFQTAKLSKAEAADIVKAMAHFGVRDEVLPARAAPYPRVVQSLYEDWTAGGEGGRQRERGIVEKRKIKNKRRSEQDSGSSSSLFTTEELKNRLRRQLQIEQQGYLSVPSIAAVKKSDDPEEEALKESTHQLMRQWRRDLASTLRRDTEDFHTVVRHLPAMGGYKFFGPKQYPFLALLPADVWADILVEQVVIHVLGQQQGVPVTFLCRLICDSAWHKYVVQQKKERGVVDKTSALYHQFTAYLSQPSSHHLPYRQLWQAMDDATARAGSLSVDIPKWSFTVASHVGTGLLSRLMDVAKFNTGATKSEEGEVAFYHSYEPGDNGWLMGHIRGHQKLYQLFKKYYLKHEATHFRMAAELSPMVIPPRPWCQVNEGGYFINPVSIMRTIADVYQHHSLLQQAPNLNAVFDSLNVLGTSPWRINTRILDLVTEVFNSGGDEGLGVPVRDPIFPEELESREPSRSKDAQMKKLRNESYSLWMDMLYRLSLANHFRDELFWLPHNMDFRGRVYPVPPHLSHLTSDVGRAVLEFGAGHPLGEKGLDWLKIHLVNLHGHKKKASLEERGRYADEMMPLIMDSADNPMQGSKWWQSGDNPWQLLACCTELTAAIHSGHPPSYISHIPVHQDGSCNGLQHYAALGRDWLGAKQVNLIPGPRPEDSYAGVAAMVEEQRRKDAADGHEIALKLEGKISRKVVKQTVMTVVYGVTWVGGRLQIAKQLRGAVADEHLWDCSAYVVGEVFRALRQSFANARGIQDWLSASARKVSLAGRPMEWVTPLGLPVVQPYHKTYQRNVLTQLQGLNMRVGWNPTSPPDTRKQKNAMPPNFVHSLDSTHMMLTALHAHRAGISFVAVHDSYWTHACFVDTMNRICREQFVTLHNEPILSDLAQFLEQKFGNLRYKDNALKKNKTQTCKFRDPFPTIGDLDLKEVLNSTYFFS